MAVVPLHSTLTETQLIHVLTVTRARIVFGDEETLKRCAPIIKSTPVTHLVYIGPKLEFPGTKIDGIKCLTLSELEELGAKMGLIYEAVPMPATHVHSITFTSGSTGMPKGAPETGTKSSGYLGYCFSDDGFRPYVLIEYLPFAHGLGRDNLIDCIVHDPRPYVLIEYLPFAHGLGRDNLIDCIVHGGREAIFTRNLKYLFEDTALVRPTSFYGVPAIWNGALFANSLVDLGFYGEYETALSEAHAFVEANTPVPRNAKEFETAKLLAGAKVRAKFRATLGGRLFAVQTGTAKLSPVVLAALRAIFTGSRVDEYYGITEVGGVAANGIIHEDVGWRLQDVPDLGYFSSDKPFPRGELIVKTNIMIDEYYEDSENTKSNFTDGWFHTGDIVELLDPTRRQIKIVDRRKYMVKLSNGEFVAPSELEGLFAQSPLVAQIYVHGDLLKDFLVAVVVPKEEPLRRALNDTTTPFETLITLPISRQILLSEMRAFAKREKVADHEVPQAVALTLKNFTADNGLLTSSFKNCRRNLADAFIDDLTAMFGEVEKLRREINGLLHSALDLEMGTPLEEGVSLPKQGLSSVASVRLALALSELSSEFLGVSNNAVIDLMSIANASSVSDLFQIATSKPKGTTQVGRKRFELPEIAQKDLDLSVTADFKAEPPSKMTHVLLTGATGFLGVVLLKTLLRRNNAIRVSCLIRSKEGISAETRLRVAMKWWPEMTQAHWERVHVLEGDLTSVGSASPLEDPALQNKIDTIVHVAAHVHWTYPYERLRNDNILATVNLLQFAVSKKLKTFCFISTISAATSAEEDLPHFNEIGANEAPDGYSLSKMVSEHLVQKVSTQFSLPAAIIRAPFLAVPQEGHLINPTDFLCRFVRGVKELGSAPAFEPSDGLRVSPVDHFALGVLGALCNLEDQINSGSFVLPPLPLQKRRMLATGDSFPLQYSALIGSLAAPTVPFASWLEALSKAPRCPLFPLLPIIRDRRYFNLEADECTHDRWRALTKVEKDCPALDPATIARFVADCLKSAAH